jgi:RNA polymerase sigma factor (sigma-70 family)
MRTSHHQDEPQSRLASEDDRLDESLVRQLRQRRPEALEELLARHGREIQAVAFLILRDRSAAEDVLVETAMVAWERARELRDPGALRAWLLRTATNRSLSARRRSVRVLPLTVVPDERMLGTVRDPGPEIVVRVALLAGMAALPPRMRAAVVLRYYADLSVADVAACLGTSPNTIKAQLQTALDKLRVSLAEPAPPTVVEASHG